MTAALPLCLRQRLPLFAAALWWGGLTALGLIAVPLIFMHAPSTAVAGPIAAKLFSASTWLAVACGMLLVLCFKPRLDTQAGMPAPSPAAMGLTGWALAGVIAALLIEFAVAPRILTRVNLALWHNLGSALYGLQWLCAGVVLWRLSGRAR